MHLFIFITLLIEVQVFNASIDIVKLQPTVGPITLQYTPMGL